MAAASVLSIQLSGPSGPLGSSYLAKLPSQPIAVPTSSSSVANNRMYSDDKGSSSTTLPILPTAGSFTCMRGKPSDNSFTSRGGLPITNSFTSRATPVANSFTSRGYLPTSFSRMSRAALGVPAPKPETKSSIPGIYVIGPKGI